ncbi:MAG TPA: hypothetical protein DCY89_07810 [Gammaproteobacteria bacterium]|nr:hypothetical protein [Gammaproteobacteria bacterium]
MEAPPRTTEGTASVTQEREQTLEHLLVRERSARRQAEALLGHKTHALYQANEVLQRTLSNLEGTISERTRALARTLVDLRGLAYFDGLTGAANRRLYRERLTMALAEARHGNGLALLCIDLDDFKHVNDCYGHSAGDEILRRLANRLRDGLGCGDTIARLAGDQFGVLLTGTNSPEAVLGTAENLRSRVAEAIYPTDLGVPVIVRCSIGIAQYPEHGENADALTSAADTAMYQAKRSGKDCTIRYDALLGQVQRQQFELEQALWAAIADEQFDLYYQPKITLEGGTRRTVGFEALLRWQHPLRGLLEPAEFIPFAESRRLIVPLGEWVLNRACRDARALLDAGLEFGSISINVTARQVAYPGFIRQVEAALRQTELPGCRLQLEITESVLIDDTARALDLFDALQELGVRVCLDDFGTRHASFGYLRRFSFDVLKIDRSFIDSLPDDPINVAIIESILPIAEKLGMTTVVEGVETTAQLEFLSARGCHTFQGFLFARPMPLPEACAYLA